MTQRLLARRIPPAVFPPPGEVRLLREECGFRASWSRGAPAPNDEPPLPSAARAVLGSKHGKLTLEAREAGVLRILFEGDAESGLRSGVPGGRIPGAILPAGDPPIGFAVDETRDELRFAHVLPPGAGFTVAVGRDRGEIRIGSSTGPLCSVRIGIDPRVFLRERLLGERRWRRIADLSRDREWTRAVFQFRHPARFYGGGEKAGSLEKSGARLVFWNTDDARYHRRSDPLYQSEPVVIAVFPDGAAAAVVLDDPRYTDLSVGTGQEPELSFRVHARSVSAHLVFASDLRGVLEALGRLLGAAPLPPLWALGYHQSRWSYASAAEVTELAAEFRRRKIPCDALYLDIDYMDRLRDFTWSRSRFPEPAGMLATLHAQGFRAVAVLDPALAVDPAYEPYREGRAAGHFLTDRRGRELRRKVWPGTAVFPDFLRASTRDWWASWCARFVAVGVDGLWTDMNEPSTFDPRRTLPPGARHDLDGAPALHRDVHNLYGFSMCRATREGLLRARPGVRPFVLTRSTFLGGQRDAATWTGDNRSDWDHLRLSIPMLLNLGLSGFPLVGADIGGFLGSPGEELYVRWLEAGVFYPLARNHSAHFTARQEPWAFGPGVEAIARRLIALRYALLPYLYTVAEESSRTGLPILRPIFFDDVSPEATKAEWTETEFLVGDAILVAPALRPRLRSREVFFPAGEWVALDPRMEGATDPARGEGGDARGPTRPGVTPGERRAGGTVARVECPPGSPPLFVRAGAAVPITSPIEHTGALRDATITFLLKPDRDGRARGQLYLDDGETDAFRRGAHVRLEVSAERAEGGFRCRLVRSGSLPWRDAHAGPLAIRLPGEAPVALDPAGGEFLLQSENPPDIVAGSGR